MPEVKYTLSISRPNGLPPIVRTYLGISRYNPSDRIGPLEHVVIVNSEGEPSMWRIVDLEMMQELLYMLADMEMRVDCYSVLKPLPAFVEV